jgi:O-antigen/teichoic acid export membrane protein
MSAGGPATPEEGTVGDDLGFGRANGGGAADAPLDAGGSEASSAGVRSFGDRVLVFFGSQLLTAGLGIFNGFFLARLLGPAAKGDYYLLTFLPPTLMVVAQLGLAQAFAFDSARGLMTRLVERTVILTLAISTPILIAVLLLLPVLQRSLFHGVDSANIVVPLLALPLLMNATLTTAIVVGRQAARWLAGVNILFSVSATTLILILSGILGLGVRGAIAAFLISATIQAIGFFVAASRVRAAVASNGSTSTRALLRYGLPYYPGSLTQFFGYRADVYILALLLADAAAGLGYYSMAVSMAELVFFFPNAVSAFFFPHVAAAGREDADRQVPIVSRVTLLLTAAVGLALVPISALAIAILLPAFGPSLPALYVILPGVIAVSVSKVLGGYVSGLGRTGVTSKINIAAFVLNIVLNIVLIPPLGIIGASAASLVSYTASSVAYSIVAGRLAGVRAADFWMIRRDDVQFAVTTSLGLVRRIRGRLLRAT